MVYELAQKERSNKMGNLGGCEAVKQTGWSTAMGNLENNIAQLKDRLECLANRIEPMLSPEQPTNAKNLGQPTCPKAKALIEIDNASDKINTIRIIIDELISRIEL